MPRPAHNDPPVYPKLAIPESVYLRVELALTNPATAKPYHGARGALVTHLLRQWLAELEAGEASVADFINLDHSAS